MKKRVCYMFIFDGFADWEPSLATAGLSRFTDFTVKTFSLDGNPVRSMGNLQVVADMPIGSVFASDVDLLLLPGGDAWDAKKNLEVIPLVKDVIGHKKIVAAICGATGFLAQHGFLDEIKHTSNSLEYYLSEVAPDYKGHAHYVKAHAVQDGNFITANGTAMTEFANAIFEQFNLFEYKELKEWFQFFQNHETVIE